MLVGWLVGFYLLTLGIVILILPAPEPETIGCWRDGVLPTGHWLLLLVVF